MTPTSTDSKLVTGDLDSSLANLASNLNFGPAANRNFASVPARGPPMATQPAGFNPFPQHQQQMAPQEIFSTPAPPPSLLSSSQTLPNLSPSPSFPAQNNFQANLSSSSFSSPFMASTASNNAFFQSSPHSQFADPGALNGSSGGQFLNNNALLPSKQISSPGLDQIGLL